MNALLRRASPCPAVAGVVVLMLALGCGKTEKANASPEPFKKAIAEYLERNNMAMALKEIKEGPTVKDNSATLTASLTHAALPGPAVTWQIQFEKDARRRLEGKRPWWGGRSSKPVGAVHRSRVGSTPIPFRQLC